MQVLGLSLPLWQKISLLVLGIALVIVSLSFMARGRRTGEESTLSIFGMELAGGCTVVFTLGLLSSVIAPSSLENGELGLQVSPWPAQTLSVTAFSSTGLLFALHKL